MVLTFARLREEYLANAEKAQAMADIFADSSRRESWLEIAKSYRQLAEQDEVAATQP